MTAVVGVNYDTVRTSSQTPDFAVGTIGELEGSTGTKRFIYVQTIEAITAAGYCCVFDDPDNVEMADLTATTPGTKGPGCRAGVAMAAIASGGFGWLQIYGKGSLRTLASAARGTQLNTTATPGALDDDATAGSEVIAGIVLGTATGGAEATNTDCFMSYPTVNRTL